MSIINAFNVARSGLNATSQWAELVSRNIANASNDSYGRQSLNLTTSTGGTLLPNGVERAANEALNTLYRQELGQLSRQGTIAGGLTTYGAALGDLESPISPANKLAEFHASLTMLYNDPADPAVQLSVVQTAQSMVSGLNKLSESLDATVRETNAAMAADVKDANGILSDLAKLNRSLGRAEPQTENMASLLDRQTSLLNDLAEMMDFRVEARSNGVIDIQTSVGYRLVEKETAYEITYIAGNASLHAGGVDISPPHGVSEGRLAGQIALVSDVVPQIRSQLDEFARGLMQTFEQSDASLAVGQAGLFTDAGAAFNAANQEGLAGRIAVNVAVRPEMGGVLSRVRDGIGAAGPGPAGAAGQVGAFLDALEADQAFAGATGMPPSASLAEAAVFMVADQQGMRAQAQIAQENLAVSTASLDAARLNAQGVNIDDELQLLLTVERSYSANSKVVSTLTNMLDTLLAAV
jgi:flagellar hook-associated protein 1